MDRSHAGYVGSSKLQHWVHYSDVRLMAQQDDESVLRSVLLTYLSTLPNGTFREDKPRLHTS